MCSVTRFDFSVFENRKTKTKKHSDKNHKTLILWATNESMRSENSKISQKGEQKLKAKLPFLFKTYSESLDSPRIYLKNILQNGVVSSHMAPTPMTIPDSMKWITVDPNNKTPLHIISQSNTALLSWLFILKFEIIPSWLLFSKSQLKGSIVHANPISKDSEELRICGPIGIPFYLLHPRL